MKDEIQITVRKSDMMAAIEAYLNQNLLKIRLTVTELEVGSDEGDDIFHITAEEDHPVAHSAFER